MGKWIERIFRFIEMIGITALIASVFGTGYPGLAAFAVGALSAAASAYLVLPIYEYCRDAVSEGGTRRSQLVGSIVTLILFVGVESLISYKVVLTTAELINSKINPPAPKKASDHGGPPQARPL
jgi:predicted PurR-regulated permease PerM